LRGARAASERVELALVAALPAGDRAKFAKMLAAIVAAAENTEAEPPPVKRAAGRRPR
jgi:hypothetical protein